jgi:hypothetical protein
VLHERYARDAWKVRIDAVEVFEPYIRAHHRHIYHNILIGRIELAGVLLPGDHMKVDDENWHCFTLSRYDRNTGSSWPRGTARLAHSLVPRPRCDGAQ